MRAPRCRRCQVLATHTGCYVDTSKRGANLNEPGMSREFLCAHHAHARLPEVTARVQGIAVVARSKIVQPPCAETDEGEPAPDVPAGTAGAVEELDIGDIGDDDTDAMYWVRFPEPYGGVLCEPGQLDFESVP